MPISNPVKKVLFLFLSLTLGLFFTGVLCISFLSKIPSDFSRTENLLRFAQSTTTDSATLVIGNSIAMDGFNAHYYSTKACLPTTYNLSSPGQNQLESLLLISSFHGRPQHVIHFYNTIDLNNQDYLSKRTTMNFLLFGYQPNDFVKQLLSITHNASTLSDFSIHPIQVAFESRWLVTNYINTAFRHFLRSDLQLDHLTDELYYPRNYTSRLPDAQRLPLISQFNPPQPVQSFVVDSIKWHVARKIGEHLHARGVQYTIVFTPVNPELDHYKEGFFSDLRLFTEKKPLPYVNIVNLSSLLQKEDFVDHLHPSETGAQKISLELAKRFSQCSSKP